MSRTLAAHWLGMSESALCGSRRDAVLNVARRRPYLFSSDRLRRLAASWVPTYHLENLAVPVVVATTDIATGRAVHHDHGYIPDLLAASAALPASFPPVTLKGPEGPSPTWTPAIAENVPLPGRPAIAEPGDRIYVLDVTRVPQTTRTLRNPLDVIIASLVASVRNREEPAFPAGTEIVRCKLDEAYDCGPVFDFSRTADLVPARRGGGGRRPRRAARDRRPARRLSLAASAGDQTADGQGPTEVPRDQDPLDGRAEGHDPQRGPPQPSPSAASPTGRAVRSCP